jgi:ribonucleoside-diphosphate reductase beta chain
MSNLLKERAYYKPFNYPWAFEYYQQQQQMHWLPLEVNLADDLRDYRDKLTPENRRLINQIFRFFTQADVDVCCGYAKHYLPTFKQPEVRMMLVAFAAMEAVHQEAYSLMLETLGFGNDEYQKFFEHKEMLDKHEYLSNFGMDTPANIAKTMAIYSAFTEGVQLFSSFAILLNFPRHNLMKGMGQIITWSVRDESLHVEGMSHLFRAFIEENPQLWQDDLKYDIYCAAERTVELEDSFIDLCFENAQIPDLTPEDVKKYIRYITDRRLLGIGLKGIFEVVENPLPWLDYMLNGIEHTNFFENRATEYSRASTTGNFYNIGEPNGFI